MLKPCFENRSININEQYLHLSNVTVVAVKNISDIYQIVEANQNLGDKLYQEYLSRFYNCSCQNMYLYQTIIKLWENNQQLAAEL